MRSNQKPPKQVSSFAELVYKNISKIPKGRVICYSSLALVCGKPSASRQVGKIAHFGPPGLPWHRLVMKNGSLARGFVPGGPSEQERLLKKEGVIFIDDRVDIQKCRIDLKDCL